MYIYMYALIQISCGRLKRRSFRRSVDRRTQVTSTRTTKNLSNRRRRTTTPPSSPTSNQRLLGHRSCEDLIPPAAFAD